VLQEEGKLREAEKLYREALAVEVKLFGKDDYGVGGTLGGLGRTLAGQGRLDEAESLLRQSVVIQREARGDDYLGRIWVLLSFERVLRKQGKLLDAKTALREAIKLFQENHAAYRYRQAQNDIAWRLATYPDPEIRDGRGAVTYAEKAVAATSRANASYLDTLAAAHAEAGDFVKAVAVQKEAMALMRTEAEKQGYTSRLKLYESGLPYREQE
jgi:tetratricopeptide (TPR) repeat protein